MCMSVSFFLFSLSSSSEPSSSSSSETPSSSSSSSFSPSPSEPKPDAIVKLADVPAADNVWDRFAHHPNLSIYEGETVPDGDGEDEPYIVPYLTRGKDMAVLIFADGGYTSLDEASAENVADALNRAGYSAFIVYHRPDADYTKAFTDACRAIQFVRYYATSDFTVSPASIVVCGFGSGGHLCAMLATHFDFEIDDPTYVPDAIDAVSARPDAAVLAYPVVTLLNYTFAYCAKAFTRNDLELSKRFSGERSVTENTSPIFMWHRRGDTGVPPQNSIQMALALHEYGIPYELHVFSQGGHGGAADSYNKRQNNSSGQWFDLSVAFLDKILAD